MTESVSIGYEPNIAKRFALKIVVLIWRIKTNLMAKLIDKKPIHKFFFDDES